MSAATSPIVPAAPTMPAWGPAMEPVEASELQLLRLALNQIDYGVVVVDTDSAMLQFANALGHASLQDHPAGPSMASKGHGLRLLHGRVMAQRACDNETLRRTLARARSGLRGFLCLGERRQSSAVAVLPLTGAARPVALASTRPGACALPSYASLVFAKQHLCDDSTIALFARECGLTGAEGQVLAQVCKGLRPAQIALDHGVRISTVRTQLRSVRQKTGCGTIRELVQKVSVLPPMARQLSAQARL